MYATDIAKRYKKILGALLGCMRRVEAFLGPDDDWVEADRRIVYEAADGLFGHSTVSEGNKDDFLFTAGGTPDTVERVLHEHGFDRNLLSTRKYRIKREHHTGGRQWADGSWVLELDNERQCDEQSPSNGCSNSDTMEQQLHVYVFATKYGNTDVYAHVEPSVVNPVKHLDTSTGVHGDPTGTVKRVLEGDDINTVERNI